ncbi:hypothetical protein HKX48_003802, partial [Thoreauomyces humboldtii]
MELADGSPPSIDTVRETQKTSSEQQREDRAQHLSTDRAPAAPPRTVSEARHDRSSSSPSSPAAPPRTVSTKPDSEDRTPTIHIHESPSDVPGDSRDRLVPDSPGRSGGQEFEMRSRGKQQPTPARQQRPPETWSEDGFDETTPPPAKKKPVKDYLKELLPSTAWITPNLTWKGLRPVLRSSIALFGALLLNLIYPSEVKLGQAGFLTLIVATICPASYPIATHLEMTILQLILVCVGWAYGCMGLAIAYAVRREHRWTAESFPLLAAAQYADQGLSVAEITTLVQNGLFEGAYLEAGPAVVCSIFMGVGCGFLLFLRQRLGPGPIVTGLIFGIIMLVIMFSTGVLFPYPYYSIGAVFMIPFSAQLAINVFCSLFVFPETLTHQFADRLVSTLGPLHTIIKNQTKMLDTNPRSTDWLKFNSLRTNTAAAMAGVGLLGASETNLTRQISFGKVKGKDFTKLLGSTRVLAARTTGFVFFQEFVEKHMHQKPDSVPAADQLVIRIGRPRAGSDARTDTSSVHRRTPTDLQDRDRLDPNAVSAALADLKHPQSHGRNPAVLSQLESKRPRSVSSGHSQRHHQRGSTGTKKSTGHPSLHGFMIDALQSSVDMPKPVGVMESQRYMDLEDYMNNPSDQEHIEEIIKLLSVSSKPLLQTLDTSIEHLISTIRRLKRGEKFWLSLVREDVNEYEKATVKSAEMLRSLDDALKEYREDRRLDVIKPFASLFDPAKGDQGSEVLRAPSHRGLYWALSYQFALLGFADALREVYSETILIEKKRRRAKVNFPDWAHFSFSNGDPEATLEEESPDSCNNIDTSVPFSSQRDPDFQPPMNRKHLLGIALSRFLAIFSRKDVLFGVKMAVIISLCGLPAFFPASSSFFYHQRGIWVLIMVALTSTLYVGDTAFGFVTRCVGTFAGAVIGLLLWSIAAQTGPGNPYAVGVVAAFFLPFLMFYRVHFQPIPAAILPPVTAMLVVGYSWQDAHNPAGSSVGSGFEVAWRRFVCVVMGVALAYLCAFIPPCVTQKQAIRETYANVIGQSGSVLCQIISFANCKDGKTKPPKLIVANLATLRAKLAKTTASRAMIKYEISLRGGWPGDHYASLQNLSMELLDLMGQLLAVLASLDKRWTTALLHRSQLSNPQFLGQLLTTFQLISTALQNRTSLPMLYNPLLEQFLRPPEAQAAGHVYGFDVTMESNRIEGLPVHVDLETICSIEYLRFSCGISQCYAIVNLVTKSLVGESYLLYGLEEPKHHRGLDGTDQGKRWLRDDPESH